MTFELGRTPTTRNRFRRSLEYGRPLIGIWSMMNCTTAVEGLSQLDFDWLLIDGEHAPVSLHDAIDHLRAMSSSSTVPIVRLPWNDPILIKRFLDAGAETLMLPYIQTAEEAKSAVDAMRYPPAGTRGLAAVHRASHYGLDKSYLSQADDTVALIAQIETPGALENVEEIAAVSGVDAVFFGPGDLSAGMGHLGNPTAAPVLDGIIEGHKRIGNLNVASGALAPTPEVAERFIAAGFDFVSVANDIALMLSGAAAMYDRIRRFADERLAHREEA